MRTDSQSRDRFHGLLTELLIFYLKKDLSLMFKYFERFTVREDVPSIINISEKCKTRNQKIREG